MFCVFFGGLGITLQINLPEIPLKVRTILIYQQ
jgi:hypothetical protein